MSDSIDKVLNDSNLYGSRLVTDGILEPALLGEFNKHDVTKPKWFDETLFNRGKLFFEENFLSVFVSNLVGLYSILHFPNIRDVLSKTQKSSDIDSAARRYLSTLRHLRLWYLGNVFKTGDKANKSILTVRALHRKSICKQLNSSQGNDCVRNSQCASQLDMVVTQWAFCGVVALKWKELGINEDSLHLLDGFNHFWRTMGYLMGIEDRFNLCPLHRKDICVVDEWKENCSFILHQVVKPAVKLQDSISQSLVFAMLNGSSRIVLFIDQKAFECYSLHLLEFENEEKLKRIKKSSNFYQNNLFRFQVHFLGHLLHLPHVSSSLRSFVNYLLHFAITYCDHPYTATCIHFTRLILLPLICVVLLYFISVVLSFFVTL